MNTKILRQYRRTWDSAGAGESFDHFQAKVIVAATLEAVGLHAVIEHDVSQGTGYALRVDVAVPATRHAFEVVRNNHGYAAIKHRKLVELGWTVTDIEIA